MFLAGHDLSFPLVHGSYKKSPYLCHKVGKHPILAYLHCICISLYVFNFTTEVKLWGKAYPILLALISGFQKCINLLSTCQPWGDHWEALHFALGVHPHKLVRLIFGAVEKNCQTTTCPDTAWGPKLSNGVLFVMKGWLVFSKSWHNGILSLHNYYMYR